MLPGNLILVICMIVMAFSIYKFYRKSSSGYACFAYFGALFWVLYIVVPLISNAGGYAYTVRWGQEEKIIDDNIYLIYSMYVLLFSLVFTSFSIFWRQKENEVISRGIDYNEKRLHFFLGMGVVLGGVTYVIGTGMSLKELVYATRFAWFADGTVDSFYLNVGLYLFSLIAPYAYYDYRRGFPNKTLSIIVYSLIAALIVVSGGRKWVIFLMSGFAAAHYDLKGRILITKKSVLIISVCLLFLYVWQYGRNMSFADSEDFAVKLYDRAAESSELFMKGDATYFYRASLEAIKLNYNEGVIYPLAVIRRVVFLPIPESLTYGLKPEGVPEMFAKDIGAINNARTGNMPPGIIGLFALSFGSVLGVAFFSIFVAGVLYLTNNYIKKSDSYIRSVTFSYFIVASLLLLRGSIGGLYFMTFGILFSIFAAATFRFLGGPREKT